MSSNALNKGGLLSPDLIEEAYNRYLNDPSSVDQSWREFFASLDEPTLTRSKPISSAPSMPEQKYAADEPVLSPAENRAQSVLYYPRVEISSQGPDLRAERLIEAYRTYGHLAAATNPLAATPPPEPQELMLEHAGFTKQDLPDRFPSYGLFPTETAPLLEIVNALKETYCDKIGIEYMNLGRPDIESWLQDQIEHKRFRKSLSVDHKKEILDHLNKSEIFESFIHTKYVGQKRFSLEGAETLIPMLSAIIDDAAAQGVDEVIFGMAHRGRLNVLCNIFDKSYGDIFSEFEEGYIPASVEGSGDVKYHKGFYSEVKTVHGHEMRLTLSPNPSHLESVDAVVQGQARGRQDQRNDLPERRKVLPLLIHGDAAISGQGVVYETLQLSRLKGYSSGGTIHLVINNQIGFTTVPEDSRSTRYCTDIAKVFGAPVFHVNGEDPEGCVFAAELAVKLRQLFHTDVFIELMCYRKYGHNESDEPAFTQPHEYQIIRKKRPVREIYRDELIRQGVLDKATAEALETAFKSSLQKSLEVKRSGEKGSYDPDSKTSAAAKNDLLFQHQNTGVPLDTLREIGTRLCTTPDSLALHPKLAVLQKERLSMVKGGEGARQIDWGMGELLAYATLLWEGSSVRLSGQDSCRGTFSHRHAMMMDQVKEQGYIPLNHLKEGQGRFEVYNSPLSEYAVLGFEYGYSIGNTSALAIWEAQFGDFANGAQIIIDQYIATAEQKWQQKFNLTLLLPHGYEGQGPEHSSARIERFLTLAGDNNMLIVNPTTPAQLFHLIRRQVVRPLKKPLIVFTPKGLLRHPHCTSPLVDLTKGSFQEILDDPHPPKRTRRLALCSGRIYYDLVAERDRLAIEDLSIVRIEQLYPLDIEKLKTVIGRCNGLKECLWVQEEPSNMGAWTFIRHILRDLLPKEIELNYIGRTRSASPAAGSHAAHKKEHSAIMHGLFGGREPSLFDIGNHFKA